MKISELLEEESINLIGRMVNGEAVTKDTPKQVWTGKFFCDKFKLTSLIGSPKEVYGDFSSFRNELKTLEGGPQLVRGFFTCHTNKLKTLEGAPSYVGRYVDCAYNQLTSLKGAPQIVGDYFVCSYNKLTSLKDIHKQIKEINGRLYCAGNPIKSHILGVLLIQDLTGINIDNREVEAIVNKYLPNKLGREALYDCQEELINAGFEEYAQL